MFLKALTTPRQSLKDFLTFRHLGVVNAGSENDCGSLDCCDENVGTLQLRRLPTSRLLRNLTGGYYFVFYSNGSYKQRSH